MLGKVEYASTLYFPINISTINIISYLVVFIFIFDTSLPSRSFAVSIFCHQNQIKSPRNWEDFFSFPLNLVLAFFCKTALRFVSFGSIVSLFFLSYCVLKTASKYDCLVYWSHHLFTSGPASLERFMQDCKIHCEIHFSLWDSFFVVRFISLRESC